MALSTTKIQKDIGRPRIISEDSNPTVFRMPGELRELIDDWRREQADLPSRSEAIRRLLELALGGKKGRRG